MLLLQLLKCADNTQNAILPLQQDMAVTLAAGGTTLKAGQPNLLVLTSKVAGMALDGALIHARTNASVPVGSFKDAGGIFVAFPGCGKTKQGVFNGVVHSDLVSGNVRSFLLLSVIRPSFHLPLLLTPLPEHLHPTLLPGTQMRHTGQHHHSRRLVRNRLGFWRLEPNLHSQRRSSC